MMSHENESQPSTGVTNNTDVSTNAGIDSEESVEATSGTGEPTTTVINSSERQKTTNGVEHHTTNHGPAVNTNSLETKTENKPSSDQTSLENLTQPKQDLTSTTTSTDTARTIGVAKGPDQPLLVPNRTLYVKNINSKIKTEQLKKDLRSIFENFGTVITIIAMNSFWRRGQAWVVFGDQASADKALVQLQGFPYSGKEMVIQYARELSDIVAKEKGLFKPRSPGPKKPRAILEREKKLQAQLQQFQQLMMRHVRQHKTEGTKAPAPQFPSNLLPPQLPAIMFAQLAQQQQQQTSPPLGILQTPQKPPQTQQQMPSATAPFSVTSTTPQPPHIHHQQAFVKAAPPTSTNIFQQQQQLPQQQQQQQQQQNLVNPLQSTTASKDAVVAAATAAAAQAVEAAAKKRAIESDSRSAQTHKIPRMAAPQQMDMSTTLRYSATASPFANPAAAMASAANTVSSNAVPSKFPRTTPMVTNAPLVPNRTLFVEQLPEDCDIKLLESVFKRYTGCGDIRHVPSRGVAFVDYDTVAQSTVALRYANNFSIKDGYPIRVSYARQ